MSVQEDQSILRNIKKQLGIDATYNIYDPDIISYINLSLAALEQIGLPSNNFVFITGEGQTWDDISKDQVLINFIKGFIYLKVKILFDPPSSSFVLDSMTSQLKEVEWRIYMCLNVSKEEGC